MLGLGTVWTGAYMTRFDWIYAVQLRSILFSKQTIDKKINPMHRKNHITDTLHFWFYIWFASKWFAEEILQNVTDFSHSSKCLKSCKKVPECTRVLVLRVETAGCIACLVWRHKDVGTESAKPFFTTGATFGFFSSQGISLVLQEKSFALTMMLF